MAVFLLPVFPAVVATKYLADCFMLLNRLEISLHLKKKKTNNILRDSSETSCDCVAPAASVSNS